MESSSPDSEDAAESSIRLSMMQSIFSESPSNISKKENSNDDDENLCARWLRPSGTRLHICRLLKSFFLFFLTLSTCTLVPYYYNNDMVYTCEIFFPSHFVYVYILSTVRACVAKLIVNLLYRCVCLRMSVCIWPFALVRRCGHLRTCSRGLLTDRPHSVECELHFWFVWLFFTASYRSFPA